MLISGIESTDLFTGTAAAPRQVVRVTVAGPSGGPVAVRVEGPGATTPEPARLPALGPGEEAVAEVGVRLAAPVEEHATRPVTAVAESAGPDPSGAPGAAARRAELAGRITAAVPGWTMWMVSHFHYDPVWWATQAAFTETWYDVPAAEARRGGGNRTALDLVRAHLDAALLDPDYKFVLAEVDYLKPYWDTRPQDRARLRGLLAEGRLEIVGGTYNEPSTNLTHPESTVRNAQTGIAFQRDVLGGDPRTAWMLDVFGHDPAFPGLMADAGLTGSSWARGPFHQWGPRHHAGANERMQFPSEFEWISPSGRGLLTAYQANHYSAGWAMESRAGSVEEAMAQAYLQYAQLKPVAATRNVLLPVGTDHVVPSRWCTQVHRAWAGRYVWPRFTTALPREFFAAVRRERGERPFSPQTRDMNPVYTGKDVSYIDTKQAQRAAETAVLDAERLAALASTAGAAYPVEALDKAWRLLAYGAHHDAVTGSESDQVYLDLLGGWREAYELGAAVRDSAADHLGALVDTSAGAAAGAGARAAAATAPGSRESPGAAGAEVRLGPAAGEEVPLLVVNTLSWPRDGSVTATVAFPDPGGPCGALVRDDSGAPVPAVTEAAARHPDGSLASLTVTFLARDVPALGHRLHRLTPAAEVPPGWQPATGAAVRNAAFRIEADPGRGGALTSIRDLRADRELLRPGALGGELALQEEYPDHPRWGEGPWHLLPTGPGRGSSAAPAEDLRAETSALGSRLVARVRLDGLTATHTATCPAGQDRVDFRTDLDGSIGRDRLLRVRFGLDLPGAKPVHEVGFAAVGRPHGFPQADAGQHPWAMDNPARTWAGLGATLVLVLRRADGRVQQHAVAVAEVVQPDDEDLLPAARALLAALAAQGVTATCTRPDGPRYGSAELDSNLPDLRIVLGGPEHNGYAARVLHGADPGFGDALAANGRVFLPADRPHREAWVPSADVTADRALPMLVLADPAAGLRAVTAELDQGDLPGTAEPYCGYSAALLNRGTPSHNAEADGTLHLTLMRACTGWPSGTWLDGERRTAPDGSGFQLQHWSHTFHYALVAGAGDWRDAGFVQAGQEYNHPLLVRVLAPGSGAGEPVGNAAGGTAEPGTAPLPGTALLPGTAPPRPLGPVQSLASVEPPTAVLSSLKARAGHPGALTARIYESVGRATAARIRLGSGIAAAHATDLIEERELGGLAVQDGAARLPLAPAEVATAALVPATTTAGTARLGPADEPVQPVFTRYWLHNKGPAPLGGLPVTVHLTADRIVVSTSTRGARGTVELDVPPGLSVDAPPLAYDLPPDSFAEYPLRVSAAPGLHYLAARIRDGAGRTLEDAVAFRGSGAPQHPLEISLAPPTDGGLLLRITNRAACRVRGEAQVLSPFGTWGPDPDVLVEPWIQPFAVPAGGRLRLYWTVGRPPAARAGAGLWCLVRAAAFGTPVYSEAVPLRAG